MHDFISVVGLNIKEHFLTSRKIFTFSETNLSYSQRDELKTNLKMDVCITKINNFLSVCK
jgi:hypothetical protein